MRGAHRAREQRAVLVLLLTVLLTFLAVFTVGLAVWSAATTHRIIDRLPVLQPPSPTPEAWLDRLHREND